jgi:hypothetical protein
MKYVRTAITVCLLSISSTAISEAPNPLQGAWEWVNIKNSCTEVYTFGIENTAYITSGEEKSDAEYTISETPSEKGFYKVTLKILDDKGGQDCGESVENNTGEMYEKYVMFHPNGNHYVSCDEEDTTTCVGPFKRMK